MRSSWLVIAVLLAGSCGEIERVRVQLTDADGSCAGGEPIESIDRVQVELRTPEPRRSPCTLAETANLQDLQGALATASFGELEEGDYSITVMAFDSDQGCSRNDIIACGQATFHLPGDVPQVPVICHDGSSPPAAFTACIAQLAP